MTITVDILPEFIELTAAIAQALGGEVLKAPTAENYWYATIDTPDMPLTLDLRRDTGRIEFRVSWPSYKDSQGNAQTVYGRDVLDYEARKHPPTLDITAALSRGAQALAKDIQRRLIPSAKPVYDAAVKICSDRAAHASNRAVTIARLAKVFGVAPPHRNSPETLYLDVARLQVSSADSISFDRFSVDADTAIKIVTLLRARKGRDES